MTEHKLTLTELLDLIEVEDYRGIIDKDKFLKTTLEKGVPRVVSDIRGALRLAVARNGEHFDVIKYPTDLSNESVNQIR